MLYDDTGTGNVRRFEVFTGVGKRRDWAPDVKAAIVAESCSAQETICAVARRQDWIAATLIKLAKDYPANRLADLMPWATVA